MLNINCQVTNDPYKWRQINEKTQQDKSKQNNNIKNNLSTNYKTNQEIDYFIAGPCMEADKEVRQTQHHKYTKDTTMYLLELCACKEPSHLLVKDYSKPYQVLQRHVKPFQKEF